MLVNFLGIKFPFQKGPTAFPDSVVDADDIRQSVIRCIMVIKGERVMRPDVGSQVLKFIFENNDDMLKALIQTEVRNSIGKYEPRVTLQQVLVQKQTLSTGSAIVVTVLYMIKANGLVQSVQVTTPAPTP